MLTLNDGRSELWQWDTKRKLTVDAECSQVHFSNKVFGRSIDVDVIDGVAIIPDILLQTDRDLIAWAFAGTSENGYTKISKVFKVNRRNKPADYVFTPPEQTTLGEILERLDDLESIQDPDAIKNAVDDYLANNPIKFEETDPTVPEWAKQPTPPDVKIPDKLPNPYSITFTGAVNASYDGSSAVEIKIPDSGEEWKLLCSLTLEEDTQFFKQELGGSYKAVRILFENLWCVEGTSVGIAATVNDISTSSPINCVAMGRFINNSSYPAKGIVEFEKIVNLVRGIVVGANNAGNAAGSGVSVIPKEVPENITKISFSLDAYATHTMNAGAVFNIYGR